MANNNNHILVTEPDRVHDHAFRLVLVDFEYQLLEAVISPLQGCKTDIIVYAYDQSSYNPQWLIDVANESDLVIIDANITSHNDVFKGYLMPMKKTWYIGRRDLEKLWPRHTNDALGTILTHIQQYINNTESSQ